MLYILIYSFLLFGCQESSEEDPTLQELWHEVFDVKC